MAIKLDTSSPGVRPNPKSFNPLPGVTSVDDGSAKAFSQIAQSAAQVSDALAKQETASQQLLINDARYSLLSEAQADYDKVSKAITNNDENASAIINEYNAKYADSFSVDNFNSAIRNSGDNVGTITRADLASNSIAELNYIQKLNSSRIERYINSNNIINKKVEFTKNYTDNINDFFVKNPTIDNTNENEFLSLINAANPNEDENVKSLFFGSPLPQQKSAFTNPMRTVIKGNLNNYVLSATNIPELEERFAQVQSIYGSFGSEYNLTAADLPDISSRVTAINKNREDVVEIRYQHLENYY